jgi:hypothetical protein
MRRTHYFGLIAAFAIAQGALIYGCSADAGAPIEDVDAAQPTPDATTGDDAPVVVDEDTGTVDAGKKDTGSTDAKADTKLTRPDTGAPGTACSPAGAPESQECGKCGTQSRVCLGGAGDAGATWSQWGACTGEATGADTCDPYEADAGVEACGNCGTRVRICQPDCKLAQGIVCQGEPPNACTPGDQNFTLALGCTDPNQGRLATCQANCQYGTPGPCQAPPPNLNTMTISATAGGVATKKFTMPSAKKLARLGSGTCPASTISTTLASYVYVEVKNPTTRAVNVSIWHTAITGGPSDTVMTAYPGGAVPSDTDANARKACIVYVNDECDSTIPTACTTFGPAGLTIDDTPPHSVPIPAGGSVTIYNSAYSASSSGDFNLNTRTEN